MQTTIHIRSTAKNWIVSIHKTNAAGETGIAPFATMPRRAYTAIGLAALVNSAQKTFFADHVSIDTDAVGLDLLVDLELIKRPVVAA